MEENANANVLRTIVVYTGVVFFTILYGGMLILISFFSKNERRFHRIAECWAESILFVSGIRVKMRGLSNIKPGRPYIFMSNHLSLFDIPVLYICLPVGFKWLAKAELFYIPVFGQAMRKAGYISIDRSNRESAFKSIRKASERIQNGDCVLIFPEGTRSREGRLKPFKKGGFVLAVDSGVPIVPIMIQGAGYVMPKKRLLIRKGDIEMTILPPIPTASYSRKNKNILMDHVRETFLRRMETD